MYNIKEPYNQTMYILTPIKEKSKGVVKKGYSLCSESPKIKCLFKTYGGTQMLTSEKDINSLNLVVDTAIIETWYNSKITAECRLAFNDDVVYEILGSPEDINMRHKTMKIKVKKYSGGA